MCFTRQGHFRGLEIRSQNSSQLCVCVAEVGVVTALVPSSLELPSELGADLVQTWVSIHLPQGWLRARGNSQVKLNIQPVPASSLKWSLS